MTTAKNKLASIGRLWGKAKETVAQDGGDFVPVPPGNYTMQFVSFEIGDFGDSRKIMTKWYVLEGPDEEHEGEICTDFDQIDDEDKLVWLQRKLVSMGVDLDEAEIETEEDLSELLQELIDNNTCCKVRVKEKDGWVNMRVQKHTEFDEPIDPSEAFSASSDDSEEEDDGEGEWEEGNRVQFEKDGETLVGEIVGFTDDDDAQVKVGRKKHVVSFDDLESIDDDDEEDETEEEEDEDTGEETEDEEETEEEETEEDEDEIQVGDRVYVDEFGEDFVGTVGSIASKTTKSGCFVEFDDGDSGNYAYADLHFVERPESEEEEDESEEEEDGDEVEKGDRVVFTRKGKEMRGEVVSVDGSNVKVKPDKAKKAVTVDIAEIDFETAD